jgi:hypothetical protein
MSAGYIEWFLPSPLSRLQAQKAHQEAIKNVSQDRLEGMQMRFREGSLIK